MDIIGIIRKQLINIIQDIDAGNSTLSDAEAISVMKAIAKYSRKDSPISKAAACEYLGIGRSKFDSLVREEKIPRGKKMMGFKELHWTKRDLDRYVKEYKS